MLWLRLFCFFEIIFLFKPSFIEKKIYFFSNIHFPFINILGFSPTSERYSRRKVNLSLYITRSRIMNWLWRKYWIESHELHCWTGRTKQTCRNQGKRQVWMHEKLLKPTSQAPTATKLTSKAILTIILQC